VGIFKVNTWAAALTATGLILGAAYMLYLYRRVIFGTLTKENLKRIADLSPREIAVFAPLVVLTIWMGVYPGSFLEPMHASVDHLVGQVETARAAMEASLSAGR